MTTFSPPKFDAAWSNGDLKALQNRLEPASAIDLLRWAGEEFGGPVALASSFSLEDVVLIDLVARHDLPIGVFSLDTGRLHQETYDVMAKIRDRYDIDIDVYFPNRDRVEEMVRQHGPNGFYESKDHRLECCYVRKVEPLGRALSSVDGWVTGLRRDQNVTRAKTPKVELDRGHGHILKFNPLADWTAEQVREHIEEFNVPYNELHDRGFPSIGCAPCTRPVEPGEDRRAGRWWWEEPESKECGLHTEDTGATS